MKKLVCLTRLYIRTILFILLCISYFILPFTVFANENSVALLEPTNWIIAASVFESNMAEDISANLVPRYILENIPVTSIREVTPTEHYQRKKKSISIELEELYKKLQEKIIERDSLVFTNAEKNALAISLEPKEREILELRWQINEKEEEGNSLSETDFFSTKEPIVLWDKDLSILYELPENMSTRGPDDINALIQGTIQHSGSFIYVKAALVLYPGGAIVEEVSDAGNIASIEDLSLRLATKLHAAIVNLKTVTLTIRVSPPEAVSNAIVLIDGEILNSTTNRSVFTEDFDEANSPFAITTIASGIHDLYIESPGYNQASIVYDFSEKTEFNVQINLTPERVTPIKVKVPTAFGKVYVNALSSQYPSETSKSDETGESDEIGKSDKTGESDEIGKSDKTGESDESGESDKTSESDKTGESVKTNLVKTNATVFINNLPALGEFVHENGVTTWFIVPDTEDLMFTSELFPTEFSFLPNTKKLADRIEKNRRRMYNSYAALIVSLPLSFIAYGEYTNEVNAFANGSNTGENITAWNIARYTTMGLSIGLGVNFFIQLGLYIYSVNAVLPEELKPVEN